MVVVEQSGHGGHEGSVPGLVVGIAGQVGQGLHLGGGHVVLVAGLHEGTGLFMILWDCSIIRFTLSWPT